MDGRPLGGGLANFAQIDAVGALNATDAWAVGFARGAGTSPFQALIERWNGTRWAPVTAPARPAGTDSRLHGIVAVSANDVWAVGSQANAASAHSLIEHWNGTAWSVVPSPRAEPSGAELVSVTSVAGGGLWAVGDANGGGVFSQLIEHWDGVRWTTVPGAPVGATGHDFLLSVAASGPADVWAVGRLGRHSVPVIEHWDGTVWKQVPQPVSGYDSNLSGVTVVAPSDVWAVGSQNLTQTVTEHWDGKAWQLIPSPSPAGSNVQNGLAGVIGPRAQRRVDRRGHHCRRRPAHHADRALERAGVGRSWLAPTLAPAKMPWPPWPAQPSASQFGLSGSKTTAAVSKP